MSAIQSTEIIVLEEGLLGMWLQLGAAAKGYSVVCIVVGWNLFAQRLHPIKILTQHLQAVGFYHFR